MERSKEEEEEVRYWRRKEGMMMKKKIRGRGEEVARRNHVERRREKWAKTFGEE